jgi:hypothetical protein
MINSRYSALYSALTKVIDYHDETSLNPNQGKSALFGRRGIYTLYSNSCLIKRKLAVRLDRANFVLVLMPTIA